MKKLSLSLMAVLLLLCITGCSGAKSYDVKMDTAMGEWFQIGVSMKNPTNEDIVIYVRAEKVEIRIE